MALRGWKPFLGLFEHVDAAIEAAGGPDGISRDKFRRARVQIVELLCNAADDGVAERICLLLDDAMSEALHTLREAVPAGAVKGLLASGELVEALGALMRGHGSERVRGLARDVVRGWRAGVEEDIATARAAIDVLDGLPRSRLVVPPSEDTAPPAFAGRSDIADAKKEADIIRERQARIIKTTTAAPAVGAKAAKISSFLPNQSAPIVGSGTHVKKQSNMEASAEVRAPLPKKTSSEDTKLEATKRKLHERYQEAEDAKRRRTIQVIQAPPWATPGQRQSKTALPAVRARGQASCTAKKRFVVSSIYRSVLA